MKIRIRPEADLEFTESALYYFEESPAVARRFADEIETAFQEISAHPFMYREEHAGIRVKVLDRFPFSLYYEVIDEEVIILAVSHQARMPGYWLNRE